MTDILWQNQKKQKLNLIVPGKHEHGDVIHRGRCYIEHPRFNHAKTVEEGGNLEKDGRSVLVDYVVIKLHGDYWTAYYSLNSNLTQTDYLQGTDHLDRPTGLIKTSGTKFHPRYIQEVIDMSAYEKKHYYT